MGHLRGCPAIDEMLPSQCDCGGEHNDSGECACIDCEEAWYQAADWFWDDDAKALGELDPSYE
jgi:hypothetical protein